MKSFFLNNTEEFKLFLDLMEISYSVVPNKGLLEVYLFDVNHMHHICKEFSKFKNNQVK